MTITAVTDARSFLEARYNKYNKELLATDEEAGSVIDRYYAPDFTIVSGGISMGRERLIKHVHPLKKKAVDGGGYFEVLEAVRDGNRIAARYIIHATLKQGASEIQNLQIEVYEFLEFNDEGLITNVHSITRDLPN